MNLDATASTYTKRDKTLKTVGYYLSFIALGLTSASLGPTLPGLAEQTRTTLSEVSFLFTARSLGYLLGSLGGGRFYDRLPGHRAQVLGLLIMVAMMALAPVVPIFWMLAIVLVLLGFGEGTLDVGGNTLLVWVHGKKVGPFMNGLHFFFGIGAFLSPVIIAQAIVLTGNIQWAYWGLALLVLPVIAWLIRLPSPEIPPAAQEGRDGRQNYGLIALLMGFFFLNVGAEGSFGGWVFTYARALGLGAEITAAYLTSAFWGALTLGRLLAIPIAARLHPRWILFGDLVCGLVSVGLLLFWRTSFVAAWVGAIGTGLSMASVFPTTVTLAERYLPINGRITGFFFVGASAGSMFFPWLIGQLFEPVGPQVVMLMIEAAQALAVIVLVCFLLAAKSAKK